MAAPRAASPGGALLRTSRLFSIPKPLPRPMFEFAARDLHDSDTATTHYPTHLAITTTQSSLAKGDWGLKRPLPLKSTTRTSTPLVRVNQLDSIEHITDFSSASDHALTLQKAQEMNIYMSTPPRKVNNGGARDTIAISAFEEKIDPPLSAGRDVVDNESRWNFKAPWLASLSEGELNEYIEKEVRRRKPEWRQFLRSKLAEDLTVAAREAARDAEDDDVSVVEAVTPEQISEEQLLEYIRTLRRNEQTLKGLVREFLDLAPPPPLDASMETNAIMNIVNMSGGTPTLVVDGKKGSPYGPTGPPRTHPSAGLSYNRTHSHLYNHPLLGPQENPPPVQARIISPKNANSDRGQWKPKLGLGGFVAEAPTEGAFKMGSEGPGKSRQSQHAGLFTIDPDIVGGAKAYVHPRAASVDPSGKVSLTVDDADPAAVAVYEATLEETKLPDYLKPVHVKKKEAADAAAKAEAAKKGTPTGIAGSYLQHLSRW